MHGAPLVVLVCRSRAASWQDRAIITFYNNLRRPISFKHDLSSGGKERGRVASQTSLCDLAHGDTKIKEFSCGGYFFLWQICLWLAQCRRQTVEQQERKKNKMQISNILVLSQNGERKNHDKCVLSPATLRKTVSLLCYVMREFLVWFFAAPRRANAFVPRVSFLWHFYCGILPYFLPPTNWRRQTSWSTYLLFLENLRFIANFFFRLSSLLLLLQMPHTVPTVPTASSFAIDMYSTYADSFDLSFLKSDETQVSTSSNGKKRTTITVAEVASQLSPCYIPTTVFPDSQQQLAKKPAWNVAMDEDTPSSGSMFYNNNNNNGSHYKANLYTCPLPSPPQDSVSSSVMSPPMAAWAIKQEHLILPPSPPESDGAFESDVDIVKNESDTEPCIDIEYFLKSSFDSMNQISSTTSTNSTSNKTSSSSSNLRKAALDHQFLRECLQDTSFQKKHNLRPIALESLFGGWNLRGDIEPVISLALEQAKCDIRATCSELDISPGESCVKTLRVIIW